MAINGSIWVEGTDLHWLDSAGTERINTGADNGASAGVQGSAWIEATDLHYIDANGDDRSLTGSDQGAVAGVEGSIWIEGNNLHYIDDFGDERIVTEAGSCSGTIDCAAARVCTVGATSGSCDTSKGCEQTGEAHRIQWSHTGCDAGCEIAVHVSLNGGSYTELFDGEACCPSDPDPSCCEFISGGCSDDCNVMRWLGVSGGSAITYDYRVRLEEAGTDTLVDSADASQVSGDSDSCTL